MDTISLLSFKFFPRSKTYDVYVYFKGEESQSTLHIKEESLIWFIEEESLHKTNKYRNVNALNSLRVLEEDERNVLIQYIKKYYKK
jgi:hypothetical protein